MPEAFDDGTQDTVAGQVSQDYRRGKSQVVLRVVGLEGLWMVKGVPVEIVATLLPTRIGPPNMFRFERGVLRIALCMSCSTLCISNTTVGFGVSASMDT